MWKLALFLVAATYNLYETTANTQNLRDISKLSDDAIDSYTKKGNRRADYDDSIRNLSEGYFIDKFIDTMVIIMTHNSLALPVKVLSPNQNYGLGKQFDDGIRGFNFDLYDDESGVKTCHGFEWCFDPHEEVMELVGKLRDDANEDRFIFVQLQDHLGSKDNVQTFLGWWGDLLIKDFDPNLPLGDYLAKGQRVLIATGNKANVDGSSGMHNTNLLIAENDYIWNQCYLKDPSMEYRRGPTDSSFGRYGKLMNSFCSLTGNGNIVASSAVNDADRIIHNARVYKEQSYAQNTVNIIMVDYYETGNVFEAQRLIRSDEFDGRCWNDSDCKGLTQAICESTGAGANTCISKKTLGSSCSDDSICASGNCYAFLGFTGKCQCDECRGDGCSSCPAGKECSNLSIFEPNECLPVDTKLGNDHDCDVSSRCESNCCKLALIGANTCKDYKWWRKCM